MVGVCVSVVVFIEATQLATKSHRVFVHPQ